MLLVLFGSADVTVLSDGLSLVVWFVAVFVNTCARVSKLDVLSEVEISK